MRSLFRTACLAALAIGLARPAGAQPSLLRGGATVPNFLGTTGLLLAPSAATVGDRGIAAHAYFTDDFDSIGALVGITDRLEVGATFLDPDGNGSHVIGNAKLRLIKETTVIPGLSAGVVDLFDALDVDPSWYVVASKDLGKLIPLRLLPLRAHVGYGGGLFDREVFAGLELRLGTPLDVVPVARPEFTAMAEIVNGDVNVGLRGRWRGFAATVALFDLDEFGGGISYTTGLRLW